MKITELIEKTGWKVLAGDPAASPDAEGVYCGDLLSWVMSHGDSGMAWVTVQTHMNVIAVAVLSEMACVILPEGIEMEAESLEKATTEGMVVLQSPLTAFDICGRMAKKGIPAQN